MERFFIVTNRSKDPDFSLTKEVRAYIEENGKILTDRIGEDTECIIVLGGDGTVLQAAADSREYGTPILGINLGTLGYLAETERKDWKKALDRLFSGEYEIEDRMMLEGRVRGRKEKRYALNDVVLARTGSPRILNYDIYVNGMYLNSFNADGIILATPTGSTAYNLSAGGPIVEPSARMILITPICPFTLTSRSVILSASDEICVRIGKTSSEPMLEAEADFDGSDDVILHTGDELAIRQADIVTRLIKLNKRSFLELLHVKMQG